MDSVVEKLREGLEEAEGEGEPSEQKGGASGQTTQSPQSKKPRSRKRGGMPASENVDGSGTR